MFFLRLSARHAGELRVQSVIVRLDLAKQTLNALFKESRRSHLK